MMINMLTLIVTVLPVSSEQEPNRAVCVGFCRKTHRRRNRRKRKVGRRVEEKPQTAKEIAKRMRMEKRLVGIIVTIFIVDRLVGPVVKASASRAEGPGFESRLRRDFFGVESYQ